MAHCLGPLEEQSLGHLYIISSGAHPWVAGTLTVPVQVCMWRTPLSPGATSQSALLDIGRSATQCRSTLGYVIVNDAVLDRHPSNASHLIPSLHTHTLMSLIFPGHVVMRC